jgi:hypothetical protein
MRSALTVEPPRTLYWLASFLILSSALVAVEIRSEALTVKALPRTIARSAEPQFVVPVATSVAAVGQEKE